MTGDLGWIDPRGNLRIVGRKKDVIIRGGHNIYPAHIEEFVVRHPMVAGAAVFPVADARLGERICLAVTTRENVDLRSDEVLSHLEQLGLSKYEMPEFFVKLDAFPLTPGGKVVKRQLVELVAAGAIKPERCGKQAK
jgi:acyl-CoA synthetase